MGIKINYGLIFRNPASSDILFGLSVVGHQDGVAGFLLTSVAVQQKKTEKGRNKEGRGILYLVTGGGERSGQQLAVQESSG
uniref:Putative ovule protein n=1 Tax=Solanum chacoense TaxID=4108 RepID=A0A0V0HNW1_SOLCH